LRVEIIDPNMSNDLPVVLEDFEKKVHLGKTKKIVEYMMILES